MKRKTKNKKREGKSINAEEQSTQRSAEKRKTKIQHRGQRDIEVTYGNREEHKREEERREGRRGKG